MQEQQKEEEKGALKALCDIEDLLEKKTKIYSRLLMDTALAKDLESLSTRHRERKETLSLLLGGKALKNKKDGGMFAPSVKGDEE